MPFKWLIIGSTFDSLTTPHPSCVQGATGDTGVVPDNGSHVLKDGYQAERFSASLMSA